MGAEDAHAVGSAQRHIRAARDVDDLGLEANPFIAAFGEAGIQDHRAADAVPGRLAEGFQNPGVIDAENDGVHAFGYFLDGGETAAPQDLRIAWIDGMDRALESECVERFEDAPAGRRVFGRAEYRDRFRTHQAFNLHWRWTFFRSCRRR